ncbi:MAG: nucleotidyltransferase domain-containing protein [Candidatus Sulfobium sp.]|jgi:predicted nucleotidyltransferase
MRRRQCSAAEKAIVLREISDALNEKDYILFAYVFGSFVSDERFGDIDAGIFVRLEERRSPLKLELRVEEELADRLRMPVDVRVINNAPLSFLYNILRRQVVVVDRDRTARADFEGLIYKKYFDFQHLRKEYLREMVNAPL